MEHRSCFIDLYFFFLPLLYARECNTEVSVETYVREESYKKCHDKFINQFPSILVSSKSTVF